MISRSNRRYSRFAVILHWLIAVLIALNFAAVWIAEDMPKPERMQIMANHKAIGITVLFLTVVRIVWRITHRPPPFRRSMLGWEKGLAHLVHTLFYIAMIGIPLTGWAMVSGRGPVSLFGLFFAPALPVPTGEDASDTFYMVHENLATLMLVLFALHVLGAIKHQFFDRDGTLGRMIPFLRVPNG